jgi:formylglycine-generating enzyme required for sulfatase activity
MKSATRVAWAVLAIAAMTPVAEPQSKVQVATGTVLGVYLKLTPSHADMHAMQVRVGTDAEAKTMWFYDRKNKNLGSFKKDDVVEIKYVTVPDDRHPTRRDRYDIREIRKVSAGAPPTTSAAKPADGAKATAKPAGDSAKATAPPAGGDTTATAEAGKPAAGRAAAETAIDLGDGVRLELVLISPGSFTMGDDNDRDAKPAHKATITKPFYLGKYEVTQEQWKAVMGSDSRSTLKGPRLPVESVHWTECLEFCAKLNARFAGKAFRLPTEAEWEYACRAGSNAKYCFGDDVAKLADYAWYSGSLPARSAGGPGDVSSVQPVGQKKPNAWGLYDMHGNVWEWCQTLFADREGKAFPYPYVDSDGREDTSPASIRKPGGPKMSKSIEGARVVRGGSWHHGDKAATSFSRACSDPYGTRFYYGFRLALPVKE